jgi:hypothetical protein
VIGGAGVDALPGADLDVNELCSGGGSDVAVEAGW